MKSVVCHSAQDLRIENTELPPLGEHQLRVNVAYGGICGSDLHYYQHGGFGTVRIKQPIALGHEISGVVDALGSQASGIQPGQRIAISPSRVVLARLAKAAVAAGARGRDGDALA